MDDRSWLMGLSGRFLVVDGPDGSGKTTQLGRLVGACREAGVEVTEVRDPGGTEVGEEIRRVLLESRDEPVGALTEMLLFMASRAQLVERRIRPALASGDLVISDRFVSSTLAYQGTAGGVGPGAIREVARIACAGVSPDLVVIFDVDEAAAARRLSPLLDRMEAKGAAFHRRVREGYLAQAREDPRGHLVVDASRGPEEVWASLMAGLEAWVLGAGGNRGARPGANPGGVGS